MKAIERLYVFLEQEGFKIAEFERLCNMSNGYLKKMRQRKADIGESVIVSILENSSISAEWLLRGEGEMLRNQESQRQTPYSIILPLQEERIAELKYTIEAQKELIEVLKINNRINISLARETIVSQGQKKNEVAILQ